MHFSTRHKVSSNRSNAETWMARPAAARQEAKRSGANNSTRRGLSALLNRGAVSKRLLHLVALLALTYHAHGLAIRYP
jgi:hypothetical protein